MALRALVSLLLALAVGLGVRWLWIDQLEGPVAGWEADAFVRAAEGRPAWPLDEAGPHNRMRPPLAAWLHHALGEAFALDATRARRLGAAGASLGALLCAFVLAVALGARTRAGLRSVATAAAAVTWAWALVPTLGALSVRPTNDLLLGSGVCLALAGLASMRGPLALLGWLLAALGVAVASLAGGVLALVALGAAALVDLVRLPAPRRALAVLALLAVGAAGGIVAQRGPDPGPLVRLQGAPLHALADLVGVRPDPDDQILPAYEAREARLLERTREATAALGARELGARLMRRAVLDAFAPRRFAELVDVPVAASGLLDAFLRGGLLLYAAAMAGSLAPRRRAKADAAVGPVPRAAVAVGLAVLALGGVATATHPFALGAVDLVLVGLAGAGMAGAGEEGRGVRRVAFGIGGVLLLAPAVAGLVTAHAPDPWLLRLGQDEARAARAVALLDEGPADAAGHLELSAILQHDAMPFLRLPEPALAHALAASASGRLDMQTTRAIAFAYVETLDFDAALALAEETYALAGPDDKAARVLLEGVTYEKRLHERSRR